MPPRRRVLPVRRTADGPGAPHPVASRPNGAQLAFSPQSTSHRIFALTLCSIRWGFSSTAARRSSTNARN
eukprot:CAMPEP_0194339788 /NCGR_PEP_ID=MMETSP0171-20130528/84363_1 /TAXON_ID=218684 /ORGANISM="Corethron pennatum, Strain L29A3" /LENGTH=69 /DNA_ID=CAMNT_0039104499 /DNA_START=221 /DNA_END=427 /DNA_ORIENTATION=-